MRILLYTFLFLLSITATAQTLKTVGFKDDPQNHHYGQLDIALLNAQDGDTIQVYPGVYTSPSTVTVTKSVTIIGPGYRQAENYLGQNSLLGWAQLPRIYVDAPGKDFILRSCYLPSEVRVYDAASVFVANNYIRGLIVEKSDVVIVHGNYFYSSGFRRPGSSSSTNIGVQVYNSSQLFLSNNIFYYTTSNYYNVYSQSYNASATYPSRYSRYNSVGSAELSNNYIKNTVNISSGYLMHSNIFDVNSGASGCTQPANAVVTNNVGTYGTASTNCTAQNYIGGLALQYEFVDFNGTNGYSLDGRYQLASNSQARGAGLNGTNCGPFGGDNPYQLSGISEIPFVWQLNVPQQASQSSGVNVGIKVKATN